jgi:hypothetical protein
MTTSARRRVWNCYHVADDNDRQKALKEIIIQNDGLEAVRRFFHGLLQAKIVRSAFA